MFNRTVTAGTLNINGAYYTFSWVNEANKVEDASIVGQTLTSDEGTVYGVHDNLISASDAYHLGIYRNTMAFALNGNVFVSEYSYDSGFFYGIYGNHFAINCNYNTFGNNCFNNTFGNDCGSNRFGNNCWNNSFGDSCSANIFGNDCENNTFGNDCGSNRFGNGCYHNSFGNSCNYNSFGNDCWNNSFRNSCERNSFGNNCFTNSFGNGCNSNSFGDYGISNSFGNYCWENSFGNYFHYNAIGNEVLRIKIPTEKIYYTHILNGTKGTYSNKLTIAFTPETKYSQFAGLTSAGVLETWVEADDSNGVDCGTY